MRQIPSEPNKVRARIEGDIEAVDRILRITKIRVHYDVRIPAGKREAAERAIATHEQKCPAATSVRGCIAMSPPSRQPDARLRGGGGQSDSTIREGWTSHPREYAPRARPGLETYEAPLPTRGEGWRAARG